jgi:hypothetical protein
MLLSMFLKPNRLVWPIVPGIRPVIGPVNLAKPLVLKTGEKSENRSDFRKPAGPTFFTFFHENSILFLFFFSFFFFFVLNVYWSGMFNSLLSFINLFLMQERFLISIVCKQVMQYILSMNLKNRENKMKKKKRYRKSLMKKMKIRMKLRKRVKPYCLDMFLSIFWSFFFSIVLFNL